MMVMALDPGGTTGVAIRANEALFTLTTSSPEELFDLIIRNNPDHVVIEWWSYFKGIVTPAGEYTSGLCYGVQGLLYGMGKRPWMQRPIDRKPYVRHAERWLKTNYPGNYVIHEVDALSHLLLWEALH